MQTPQTNGPIYNRLMKYYDEDTREQDQSRYYDVIFDPTVTSESQGVNIYQNVFNEFQDLYKEFTGTDIDLSQGKVLAKTYDRQKDKEQSMRRLAFEERVKTASETNVPFNVHLGKSQQQEHIERMSTEAQGLVEYLESYMPPANTVEGNKMRAEFYKEGGFLDKTMDTFVDPMIIQSANSMGEYHSIDTAGEFGKRMRGSFEKVLGAGLQANKDFFGQLYSSTGASSSGFGYGGAYNVGFTAPDGIAITAEEAALEIGKAGKFLEKKGTIRYEEAEPARGKFAQPVSDMGIKAFTNLDYMAYKATESLGSQILTTGLGVTASTIAQLHPAVRGAGFLARTAVGMTASLPAIGAGYVLESGDAFSSSRDELKRIRQEAIDVKNTNKKEWFGTELEPGTSSNYVVPYFNTTADMLTDAQIEEFATEIAQEYGLKSSAVELAGTALQAGYAYRAGSKHLAKLLKDPESQKIVARSMTGKTIRAIGGFAGAAGTEGFTEGVQELIQESMLEKELPRYEVNMNQIYDAAYAGGLFGGGIYAGQTGVQKARNYREQQLAEESEEKKNIREAKQMRKAKVGREYDNAIIGASLLGDSIELIVEKFTQQDGSPAAIELQNQIKGRYIVLQKQIDEISNDPARAAGFLKQYKNDLEYMDFVINERSLSNLMLQPEQIAEILNVKPEDLQSDEVVPVKKSPRRNLPVSASQREAANVERLAQEFDNVPEQDLTSIDQYDPTVEPSLDPSINAIAPDFIDELIDQAEKSQFEEIDKRIEQLKDLNIQNHMSPLDREVAIRDLEDEKERLKQTSTTTVTAEGKQTNYKALKVAQMIEIAEARGLEYTEERGGQTRNLLRDDLISLLEDSDVDTKPKTIREAGTNHAKTIIKTAAEGAIPGALPMEILNEMPDELIINHAKNLAIDVTPFYKTELGAEELEFMDELGVKDDTKGLDRDGLLNEIAAKQGPVDLNMGVPLFFKQKNKSVLHQKFRQGYYELLKQFPDSDIMKAEGMFRKWVEEYVGPSLPENLQAIFYDWANTFAPNQTLAGDIAYAIYDKMATKPHVSQAFESDLKDVDVVFMQNTDWFQESIGQQDTEGADIHTENFTHLNSAFFEAMDIVLKKDKLDEITDLAKNTIEFEDFVDAISTDEFGLKSFEGLTAKEVVSTNPVLKRKLVQFFVGNLVENNVVINDGDIGGGDFADTPPGRKTVQIQINRTTASGWGPISYTNKKKGRKAGWARATMADRFIKTPIVWLNGVNVTKSDQPVTKEDGSQYWGRSKIYGFLNTEDLKMLTSEKLKDAGLVPVFIKGDSDKIGTIRITDAQRNLDPVKYWKKEGKGIEDLAHQYLGKELTDQEMIDIYGSVEEYQAAGIARHEAYKELLGDDYHTLSAHKIMHRIKILFTPATTRTGGRKSTLKLVDLKNNTADLFTRTTYKNGDISKKNLIMFANNKNQYIGDGMTITSERVFAKKYFDEVGANPLAKRAKTVKVVRDGNNTLLMKHQEMTFNLPENASKSEIFNGSKKVAEIRREKNEVNIYVADKDGNYTKYIDHLATTDEAKVQLGDYTDFNKIHELPSEATGHIQFTEADKQKAPFPMQVTNYLNDPAFLNELNKLIEDPSNPSSAARVIDHMINISQNDKFFNEFLKNVKNKHPDSMPRMIIEMAEVGAGLHPSQLDYGSVLVKNRLFSQAMDVKQDGGVLDFRPNFVENIDKGKIVLPFGHSIKQTIARKLAQIKRVNMDMDQIMQLSSDDLNKLVKQNPVNVMLVRHPVPSRAGYRMLTVDRFENGLGDSFMINDQDVKEVFEGDYDHDTGHISILPDKMESQLIKNQTYQDEMAALSLDEWADNVVDGSIGDLNNVLDLMGEMTFGETAIGEIANVQRVAGIAQTRFGSMEIEGKTVKVNNLQAIVNDPALGKKMSLEQLYRHYAQAAFDNVSLRLLKQWDYSQEKLYKMLFYNTDGSEISDIQYQVLSKAFIDMAKVTQSIKTGTEKGRNLTLQELMALSDEYNDFNSDPNTYVKNRLSGSIETEDGVKVNAIEYVESINMKNELHPHEKLAIMPIQKLNAADISIDEFFNIGNTESRNAHNEAYKEISSDIVQLGFIMDAVGANTIQDLQSIDPKVMLSQMNSGNEWGAYMRTAMNEVYKTIEKDEDVENSKIANSMTWDYNVDFVNFVDDWLDGYDRSDGQRQRGFNELTEVEKVAATYTFLGGVYDAETKYNKRNARKIPPVSNRQGESLLHPGVMKEYFSKYNDIIKDKNFDHERYKDMPAANDKFQKTIREYMGCE